MSYQGNEYPIQLGQVGMITDMAPSQIPAGALILARNVVINDGGVQKAPGAQKYNDVSLGSPIVAIYDWWPNTVSQRMICATKNGNIYRDNGIGSFNFNGGNPINSATLVAPLSTNSKFISGGGEEAGRNKKLFFFSFGASQIQVMNGDGSSFDPIAHPSTDWVSGNFPKTGVLFRNRMWAFAGQLAYGSDTGDHEQFTSNNLVIPCFPGEGGDIIGAFVYKTKLFVFKDFDFAYVLNDSDPDDETWHFEKITSNFGLSAPNAVIETLDDMLAGNSTGTVTSYAATNALGDVAAGDIINIAGVENWLRKNSSKSGVSVQHACYYQEKKLAFFTYQSGYFTENDALVIIDLNKQNTPRVITWRKGRPLCLGLRKDATNILRPMYGSSDGFIYIMDHADRVEGDDAFTGEFQTPHINMGSASKVKLFDYLAVEYVPQGDWNLNCDYFIDGKYIDTITIPMVQYKRPVLDIMELDTDRFAQPDTETRLKKLAGSGRTISFRFWQDGENQSFQVVSLTVGFRLSGEQAQTATGESGE